MAFENLPEETKEIARKYYGAQILEIEDKVEEAYEDGYEKGYTSGSADCDCEGEYETGYAAGQAEAEDRYESEIQELKERIAELEDAAADD